MAPTYLNGVQYYRNCHYTFNQDGTFTFTYNLTYLWKYWGSYSVSDGKVYFTNVSYCKYSPAPDVTPGETQHRVDVTMEYIYSNDQVGERLQIAFFGNSETTAYYALDSGSVFRRPN